MFRMRNPTIAWHISVWRHTLVPLIAAILLFQVAAVSSPRMRPSDVPATALSEATVAPPTAPLQQPMSDGEVTPPPQRQAPIPGKGWWLAFVLSTLVAAALGAVAAWLRYRMIPQFELQLRNRDREIAELQNRIGRMDDRINQLEYEESQHADAIRNQEARNRKEIRERDATIRKLEDEIAGLRESRDARAAVRNDRRNEGSPVQAAIQGPSPEATAENAHLKKKLEEVLNRWTTANGQLADAKGRLQIATDDCERLRRELERTRESARARLEEVTQRERRVQDDERELARQREELGSEKIQLQALQRHLESDRARTEADRNAAESARREAASFHQQGEIDRIEAQKARAAAQQALASSEQKLSLAEKQKAEAEQAAAVVQRIQASMIPRTMNIESPELELKEIEQAAAEGHSEARMVLAQLHSISAAADGKIQDPAALLAPLKEISRYLLRYLTSRERAPSDQLRVLQAWAESLNAQADGQYSIQIPQLGAALDANFMTPARTGTRTVSSVQTWAVRDDNGIAKYKAEVA